MTDILLVDGSNLLFQMFYGMPARITNFQGRPIHGTLGFMGALLKVIRALRPTCVAVVFDGEGENGRKLIDENYKANREDYSSMAEEDTPFGQLPDIYAALDYLGICHRETTDCEADDWIAGYALRYGGEHRITILSQDSDFFQLIGDNVQVLRYRGKNSQLWGPDYIQQKLGIRPGQYAYFKALTGDAADNIRGGDKIGPKTAAALLNRFATLEEILQNAEQVAKPSVRRSLEENAGRLRINYELICLRGTPNLPFSLEEMAWQDTGETSTQVLTAIGVK